MTDIQIKGGDLVAAMMKDGPNFKQGYSFANALGAVMERERAALADKPGPYDDVRMAMLARDAVMAVLNNHIPTLTDEIIEHLSELYPVVDEDSLGELALRDCSCGERLNGFYMYQSHLRQVFNERGA